MVLNAAAPAVVAALALAAAPPSAPASGEAPAAARTSWLDRAAPAGWNAPGRAMPPAPPPSGEAATSERCTLLRRAPTLPADLAVVARGWTLFGPAQVFDGTEVVLAASGVDGMCRPLGIQGFVFRDGKLAGTISPVPMDSRTDGAAGLVQLRFADRLDVEFARYVETDPLCCPSRVTTVGYRVEPTPAGPVLRAAELRTAPPRRAGDAGG